MAEGLTLKRVAFVKEMYDRIRAKHGRFLSREALVENRPVHCQIRQLAQVQNELTPGSSITGRTSYIYGIRSRVRMLEEKQKGIYICGNHRLGPLEKKIS